MITQERKNPYFERLKDVVISLSAADNWDDAVWEWEIILYTYSEEPGVCACGKPHIKHIFTIQNTKTDSIIPQIGSSCIDRFDRDDLSKRAKLMKERDILLTKACKNCKGKKLSSLEFSSDNYSRGLFDLMYEQGAFEDNEYNTYNGASDRDFLVDMFNKQSPRTSKQNFKLSKLLNNNVRNWLADRYTELYKSHKLQEVFDLYSDDNDKRMIVTYKNKEEKETSCQ